MRVHNISFPSSPSSQLVLNSSLDYPLAIRILQCSLAPGPLTLARGPPLGMPDACPGIATDYCRETSNQLIVYHPPSHAIQVVPHPRNRSSDTSPPTHLRILPDPARHGTPEHSDAPSEACPLCGQGGPPPSQLSDDALVRPDDDAPADGRYFRILERAHESSRPGTPTPSGGDRYTRSHSATPTRSGQREEDDSSNMPAMGYYRRFFKEERRLGIGAEGSVFLATHVIGGNILGE